MTILVNYEAENPACGWKSCNIGRNGKGCQNTEDFKPHLWNTICVPLKIPFKICDEHPLSFLYGTPPPPHASHENTDVSKENVLFQKMAKPLPQKVFKFKPPTCPEIPF